MMTCHGQKFLLVLALFFVSFMTASQSLATASFTATGVSNITQVAGAAAPTVYYSNILGPDSTNTYYVWDIAGAGSTCNTTLNPYCLTKNSAMVFSAGSSVATAGTPRMYLAYCPGGTAPVATNSISECTTIYSFIYSGTGLSPAQSVAWSTICNVLSAQGGGTIDANCNPTQVGGPWDPITFQVYLIADANGDGIVTAGEDVLAIPFVIDSSIPINASISEEVGIYQFTTYPGDSKIYIPTMSVDANSAPGSSTSYQYAAFIYVPGPDKKTAYTLSGFAGDDPTLTTNPPGIARIAFNGDGTLAQNYISGLSNGTTYYVRSAVIDGAGNVGLVTAAADDDDGGAHDHAATPDQVVGLMSKNGNCFVATAAFGSPMAPQIQILRDFRDRILLRSKAGQRFVRWYYENGPAMADYIRPSQTLRAVVRFFLYPIIALSFVILHIGFMNFVMLLGTLLLISFITLRRQRIEL